MSPLTCLVGVVLVVLLFAMVVGRARSSAARRRRIQGLWAHKRDDWLRDLHSVSD